MWFNISWKRLCSACVALLFLLQTSGLAGAAGLELPPNYPGIEVVLTQIEAVLTTKITPEQYSLLQQQRSELLEVDTVQALIDKLNAIGVDDELADLINRDITLEEAKAIISIMVAVSSVKETDVQQVAATLHQLRQDYQELFVKLAAQGIDQQTLYAFFVDLNSELSQVKGLNKHNIENSVIQAVQEILLANPEKYAGILKLMGVALLDPENGSEDTAEDVLKKGNLGQIKKLIGDTLETIDFALVASMYSLTMDMMASIYQQPTPPSKGGGGGGGASTPAPATQEGNQVAVNPKAPTKIEVAEQGLNIEVPEAAFDVAEGAAVKAEIFPLADQEAVQVVKEFIPTKEANKFTMLGTVIDIEFYQVTDGTQTEIAATKSPIKLEFSLEGLDLNNMVNYDKVGVWKLDDVTGKAIWVGGKVDKTKQTITLERSSFSKYVIMEFDQSFVDVNQHWAQAEIESLGAKTVVQGDAQQRFKPNEAITRAEFAAMLVRLLDLQSSSEQAFTDIKATDWYQAPVAKAVQAGLVTGYENQSFKPQQSISRQEMAVMVARALQLKQQATDIPDSELSQLLDAYSDQGQMQSWAQKSIAISAKAGILKGQPDGTFKPEAKATRAEAAVMLSRLWSQP